MKELIDAVISQSFEDYEWLILDNGSTENIASFLRQLDVNGRIRIFHVRKNIHIIRGNRFLLNRALGTYIVPVDHDDLIYPDSLNILAGYCHQLGYPSVVYSDEQTISSTGSPSQLIWRTEWSRLSAYETVPAAHLMAFSRTLALKLHVYEGEYARGCHDWDTILRMADAGIVPRHIPKVLYGWRMHPGSTALDATVKNYILSSQTSTLAAAIRRRGFAEKFTIEPALPWIPMMYYHLVRQHVDAPPVALDFILRQPNQYPNLIHNLHHINYPNVKIRILYHDDIDLTDMLANTGEQVTYSGKIRVKRFVNEAEASKLASEPAARTLYKVIMNCSLKVSQDDWLWDAVGTGELDPDCGIVGGLIFLPNSRILHIGYVAGLDNFFATPCYLRNPATVPAGLAFIRRNVTAVYGGMMLTRCNALKRLGGPLEIDEGDGIFGIEYCLRCRDHGIQSAVTPRFQAVREESLSRHVGAGTNLRNDLASRYCDLLANDPYYSVHLARSSSRYGQLPNLPEKIFRSVCDMLHI
jgi:glycosyltransferase involved in cell wall biosynthesis